MAVNINVPSQVKTYANLAAFPATGALKTIYIAEDTNKTYRWTGSVYTEISASAAMTWGAIGGTLSNQTDLQSALDAKVPTSRTLTINGVTQDLSANRTFTISTGITIGSTAIASGVVGRVLFEGAGNVVQESSSLFWDATNNRLGIGTSTPSDTLDIIGTAKVSGNVLLTNGIIATSAATTRLQSSLNYFSHQRLASSGVFGWDIRNSAGNQTSFWNYDAGTANTNIGTPSGEGSLLFTTNGLTRATINFSTGNVLIGTTTDAGFKLDVNGTARVQGASYFGTTSGNVGIGTTTPDTYLTENKVLTIFNSTSSQISLVGSRGTDDILGTISFWNGTTRVGDINTIRDGALGNGAIRFRTSNSSTLSERMRINTNGNVLINTTTDAGFRLDVNGTSVFRGTTTFSGDIRCSSIVASINQNIEIQATWAGSGYVRIRTITNTPQVLIVQPETNLTLTSGTHDTQRILHTFAPTSGTAVINALTLNQTINQTGGANGITRGLYINPTLTAAADFRAIETTAGRVIFGGLPTSSAGLPTGAIWNDAGTLKIV